MKLRSEVVLFLGIVLTMAAQQPPTELHRHLRVDDFSRFEDVGNAEISPDGEWVLFTLTSIDRTGEKRQTDIWQVKWDGSQTLRLTSDEENETAPRMESGRQIHLVPVVPCRGRGKRQPSVGSGSTRR